MFVSKKDLEALETKLTELFLDDIALNLEEIEGEMKKAFAAIGDFMGGQMKDLADRITALEPKKKVKAEKVAKVAKRKVGRPSLKAKKTK